MLNRNEYRQMLLAGTVSFPATFPQLGRLELHSEIMSVLCGTPADILTVTETPSSKVTLSRRVLAASVRAVFLPRDPRNVNYSDGLWLLPGEIVCGLKLQLQGCGGTLYGIAFVAESEPSILNMSAGMTAAESVQYYPPLPGDPSHNHYNPVPGAIPHQGGHVQACSPGVGFSQSPMQCRPPSRDCSLSEPCLEAPMFQQAPCAPLFSCS